MASPRYTNGFPTIDFDFKPVESPQARGTDPGRPTPRQTPSPGAPGAPAAPAAPARDTPSAQMPGRRHREALDVYGQNLLGRLPPGTSLEMTREYFPHVINRLALVWDDPKGLRAIVDDLLVDDRPQREGFPLAVLNELSEVRDARLAILQPQTQARPRF